MAKRGRAGKAPERLAGELAEAGVSIVQRLARPAPPSDLSEEAAFEWREIVERMPADWFPRETHGMLAQYCRHVLAARRAAAYLVVIESRDKLSIRDWNQMLKIQERESRAISSLATRMRLTQQATVRADQARKPATAKKPWEA